MHQIFNIKAGPRLWGGRLGLIGDVESQRSLSSTAPVRFKFALSTLMFALDWAPEPASEILITQWCRGGGSGAIVCYSVSGRRKDAQMTAVLPVRHQSGTKERS